MKIIDMHAHTSSHELSGLHTSNAQVSELKRLSFENKIHKIILMATYFPFKKSGLANYELLSRIRGDKLFGMFASLDASADFEKGVSELRKIMAEEQVYGIKLYPGYQDFSLGDRKMDAIYELAGKENVLIMIHSGELHECCYSNPKLKQKMKCEDRCRIRELKHLAFPQEVVPVAQKFKEVTFIMSHLSNPYFSELREVMEKCPNVMTDISGLMQSGTDDDTLEYRRLLKVEIEKFLLVKNGENRVMFGTDFPIQSYKDTIEFVESLAISASAKNKIYHGNAEIIINRLVN